MMSLFALHVTLCLTFISTVFSFQKPFGGRLNHHRLSMNYDVKSKNGVHTLSFEVAGKQMSFETGKIGRQAAGAVVARTGDTMIYSTVCYQRDSTPVDFTPLRVDHFARYSAVGQTTGSFHRKDSRGDDNEILVARLIDRPMRPVIAEGWQHETQVLTWVLSYDKVHPPEALAICAASAAMCISDVPMIKPIAGVEVGIVDGVVKVNPSRAEMDKSPLQLTVAGTKDGVLMIEGLSDFLSEEVMVEALSLGHKAIGEICDALQQFQSLAGSPKKTDTLRKTPADLVDKMDGLYGKDIIQALSIGDKHERGKAVAGVESKISAYFATASATANDPELMTDEGSLPVAGTDDEEETAAEPELTEAAEEDEASELASSATGKSAKKPSLYDSIDIKISMKKLLVRKLRQMILQTGQRSDGRFVGDVRPIDIETSFLPGAHGSTLFTRGETQSLATATLGSKSMEAKYETLDVSSSKRFYLQYRFPPSSVGEVGRVGMVNRREVGHGNLAERALMKTLPPQADFPYSVRAESLITESCGSSSMATVCSCCLAMLDAGVPLTTSVAGVAMGLILGEKEGEEPVILTDILGLEDALGTMDFKVAGNASGITTFQLDIKSEGLTLSTLEKALFQAKVGRLHILNEMNKVLAKPNRMKSNIPKILEFKVPVECIGKVIGPKGKAIQQTKEMFTITSINLEDDGSVQVESFSAENNEACKEYILKMADEATKADSKRGARGGGGFGEDGKEKKVVELGPPPEVGVIYRDCEIKSVQTFGVFVEVLPGYEGLVHVSELDSKRIDSPEKAGFVAGGKIDVKHIGQNDKGQMRLSRRAALLRDSPTTATGAPLNPASATASAAAAASKLKAISSAAEAAYNSE